MRSDPGRTDHGRAGPGPLALWAVVLAPPALWMLDLVLLYTLQRYVCRSGTVWLFHLTTALALALTGAAGALAWRCWRELRHQQGRRRFMARGGLALSAGSAVLIAAQALPTVLLGPCR